MFNASFCFWLGRDWLVGQHRGSHKDKALRMQRDIYVAKQGMLRQALEESDGSLQ